MATAKPNSSIPAFRVGDRVNFNWGRHEVEGVIVEDRGLLGGKGRRLYRINFRLDVDEPLAVELTADDFRPVAPK